MRAKEFVLEPDTTLIGKLAKTGKIVQVLKQKQGPAFAKDKDEVWTLIDTEPGKHNKISSSKWVPGDTEFEWAREYLTKEELDEANFPSKSGKFIPAAGTNSSFRAGYNFGVSIAKSGTNPDTVDKNTESQKYSDTVSFIKGYKKGYSDVLSYLRNQQASAQSANKVNKFAKIKSITPDQIKQIVQRWTQGETAISIAPDFGLGASQVTYLIARQPNFDELKQLNQKNRKGKIRKGKMGLQRSFDFGLDEGQFDSLIKSDQAERNAYKKFVADRAGGDWKKGARLYAKLKNRPADDIFGDDARLQQFMRIKFDFANFTKQDWRDFWLLSQHADTYPDFQQQALDAIQKHLGQDNDYYRYLADRISCARTGQQKYGTQDICDQQGVAEEQLDEGLRDWIAALAATGAMALGTPAVAKQVPTTTAVSQQAYNQISQALATPAAQTLKKTAIKAGIVGTELAQFMAQCAHETANFTSLEEFGGSLDFRKYDPKYNPRKARQLGNKVAGDGAKYKGRGFIQLTGRDNYKRAGQALGLPLEQRPELVERPDVAAKVAVWFWQNRVAPKVASFHDTQQATKPINPGMRGLQDRHTKFNAIKQGAMAQPKDMAPRGRRI